MAQEEAQQEHRKAEEAEEAVKTRMERLASFISSGLTFVGTELSSSIESMLRISAS